MPRVLDPRLRLSMLEMLELEPCAGRAAPPPPPPPSICGRRRRLLVIDEPPPIICRRAADATLVCLVIFVAFFHD